MSDFLQLTAPPPALTDKVQDFPLPSKSASEANLRLCVYLSKPMYSPTKMREELWPANRRATVLI